MILIMLVILLFFGSKNIPQLARGLGKGIREFKDATSGIQREIEKTMYENPAPLVQQPKQAVAEIPSATTGTESLIPVVDSKPELPKIAPPTGSVSVEG